MNHPPAEDYFGTVPSCPINDLRNYKSDSNKTKPVCVWSSWFQAAVPAVGTTWSGTAAAASPWSRCFTWSVSRASPATPVSGGNPSTPWTRGVTARVVTLWVNCYRWFILKYFLVNCDCCCTFFLPFPCLCLEYTRALFKVLQAHPGPDPARHGKSLPPPLFHMCGV